MDVRQTFRAALADTRRYAPDSRDRRPAFVYSLARSEGRRRRDVRALAALPRTAREGTVAAASQAMTRGELSAVDLVKDALAIIKRRQPELNAFTYVAPERALLDQALALDEERKHGRSRGPLHGIPAAIKDVLHVKDMPTTASSKVMADHVARADATAVRRLRDAGAVIIGKTHTHEFALGVTTPQSRNPWDTARDPGGSSGGSAVAVATGMSLLSLGTDTRASIRVPAALCGVVGYKPTYGLVSTDGVVTLSWSMDHIGLMARTVQDTALLMNAVQGLDRPPDDYPQYLFRDVRGFRLGLAVNGLREVEPAVLVAFDAAISALRSQGVEVLETQLPSAGDFHLATSLGLLVSRCEAAAYHQAFPNAGPLYTRPVFEQLDEAANVPAVDYLTAQRFRAELRDRMLALFDDFDALIMPTSRVTAPPVTESDSYFMVLSENCIPWSFIGFPAISVPCGHSQAGLPAGAQLVAAPFDDGALLALASALESRVETRFP